MTVEEKRGINHGEINALMRAFRRALLLVVSAIDAFLAAGPPAEEHSATD